MKFNYKNKKRPRLIFTAPALFLSIFLSSPAPVLGQDNDLGLLSLDELLNVEVTSVAKVPEKATDTPAAIYILTQEDIRRSGVQTIPEVLRMVPGVHVYQIDANKWAVSSRGFASRFSNKMLVMIDGRTVYSPLFSGVFWDVQDLMLEDIERIEVIRGPGGTLWGANAVNGVVNIISKDSADTQGGLVSLQAETGPGGEAAARFGGWLNEKTSYRMYAKVFDRSNFETISGEDAADGYHQVRGGFRMDMNVTTANKVTLQGDIYGGKSGETTRYITPFPPFLNEENTDAPVAGGNLLGRWTRTFSKDSEMIFQAYYDHSERDEFFIDETLDTADLDFQHRLNAVSDLELLWGLGYRFTSADTLGKESIPGIHSYSMGDRVREDNLFSGFLQGRLPFASDKGVFTLGTKLEHNDYSGFEWQPSGRIIWSLSNDHSLWGAISRSVRTPSRLEHDADVNIGAFLPSQDGILPFIRLIGNDETDAETVYSYETGYRGRLRENIIFDLSIYYNKYKDLVAGIPVGAPFLELSQTGPRIILPYQIDNARDGETYGAELSCGWSVRDWWRLTGGFTWFQFNLLDAGISEDARQGFEEEENADYLVSLISYMDLPGNFEANTILYYVDSLDGLDIDSYIRLDLNIDYHFNENMTLGVGARNLFNDSHQEFGDTMDGIIASEIPQTFYTKLTMTF